MIKPETRMFISSCPDATMKPKKTLWLFSAFKGGYPGLLPETNFKSLYTNCISSTPSTFFGCHVLGLQKWIDTKKSNFCSNMAAMINLFWKFYNIILNDKLEILPNTWGVRAYDFSIGLIHTPYNFILTYVSL